MALFRPGVNSGLAATTERMPVGSFSPTPRAPTSAVVTPRGPAPAASQFSAPNYGSVLAGMPGVVAANNNAGLSLADAATARTGATRQAALQFGGLPAGFQDKYGDVDAATLAAAAANPYSSMAQQNRAYGQNDYAMKQALAARGGLESGQLSTNLANQTYQRGLDLYNLGNQFGGVVNQAIGAYTGQIGQNRSDIANAILQAQHDASVNPSYAPSYATGIRPLKRRTSRFVPSMAPNHHLLERGL